MKRTFVPILATLGLLVCASAFAWSEYEVRIDPGMNGNGVSAEPHAMSFEEEMRDLRRLVVQELAAREAKLWEQQVSEQEALRRGLVL